MVCGIVMDRDDCHAGVDTFISLFILNGRTKETPVLIFVVGMGYVSTNILVEKIYHTRSKHTRATQYSR